MFRAKKEKYVETSPQLVEIWQHVLGGTNIRRITAIDNHHQALL